MSFLSQLTSFTKDIKIFGHNLPFTNLVYVTIHQLHTYVDEDGITRDDCGQLPSFSDTYLKYDLAVFPGMIEGDCASLGYPNPIG